MLKTEEKNFTRHSLERTNPKGVAGLFRCTRCGMTDLAYNDKELCPVQASKLDLDNEVLSALTKPKEQ